MSHNIVHFTILGKLKYLLTRIGKTDRNDSRPIFRTARVVEKGTKDVSDNTLEEGANQGIDREDYQEHNPKDDTEDLRRLQSSAERPTSIQDSVQIAKPPSQRRQWPIRSQHRSTAPLGVDELSSIVNARSSSLLDHEIPKERLSFPYGEHGEPQAVGITWLTAAAREDFMEKLERMLSGWGVTPEHDGACILIPLGYDTQGARKIAAEFQLEDWAQGFRERKSGKPKPPRGSETPLKFYSERLQYSYADHETSFARAVAYFRDPRWPPTSARWDRLMNNGLAASSGKSDSQEWHASHLCHQGRCVLPGHIVFEPAAVNQDRKKCVEHILRERQLGQEIPEKCQFHNPPCLLQHAALRPLGAWYIALHGSGKILGFDGPEPEQSVHDFSQEEKYQYFECKLPLKENAFGGQNSAVRFDSKYFTSEPPSTGTKKQPKFRCSFCTKPEYLQLENYLPHLKEDRHSGLGELLLNDMKKASQDYLEWAKQASSAAKTSQVYSIAD